MEYPVVTLAVMEAGRAACVAFAHQVADGFGEALATFRLRPARAEG